VGGNRERWIAKNDMGVECGIPVFGIDGMTSKNGESLLFFSVDDLREAWGKKGGKGEMPDVEVFDFVNVIKAMDADGGGKEGFKVKFVGCKEGREYKESITKKGDGKARLKPMRG